MEYSLYKTLANKYQISMSKAIAKFRVNGKIGMKYKISKGMRRRYFYDNGFKRQKVGNSDSNIDLYLNTQMFRA